MRCFRVCGGMAWAMALCLAHGGCRDDAPAVPAASSTVVSAAPHGRVAVATLQAEPDHGERIDELLADELHRQPNDAELAFWGGQLARRSEAQVRSYARMIAETIAEVYHREPAEAELVRFAGLLDRGMPLD